MSRARGHEQPCDRNDARTRLSHARKFLEVAALVATEDTVPASASVSAALAVLAGIAASDAACCWALGFRPRGQDHHNAEARLAQLAHGGPAAATALKRMLDLKDTAHYGLIHVSGQKLKAALRQAEQLVEFADSIIQE